MVVLTGEYCEQPNARLDAFTNPGRERLAGQAGFTLLEVLVALAILAIVMIALVRVGGESAQLIDRIEGDYYADIIAQDLINRVALEAPIRETGQRTQTQRIANTDWQITRTVSRHEQGQLLLVRFRVQAAPPQHGQAVRQTLIAIAP